MHAKAHHARYGTSKLEEAGTASEFVTRTIKKVLDEETTRMENGLTFLANCRRDDSPVRGPLRHRGASITRWSPSA